MVNKIIEVRSIVSLFGFGASFMCRRFCMIDRLFPFCYVFWLLGLFSILLLLVR